MKTRLLFILSFLIFGAFSQVFAQQQVLSLRILKTGEEGGVNVSYDDGEFQNEAIDKFFDDDLDMGWEGEDLNIMTTFLRYRNVTIPKGAIIDSAVLHFYAHEDEADLAKVTVFADASDNSPEFIETELIADRTWTSTSIPWDITEPWTIWQPYRSPDLKAIIQDIINRSGWVSGNSLTLFLRGEDQGASLLDNAKDFESFENIEDPEDGGDGLHHPERIPELKIYYTLNQEQVTLKVEKTGEEGGVDVSYDDGEFQNDAIDKFFDDDLDMGWEGEDLNVMTTFIRFRNVTIPQGAIIESAILNIYAHEDEADEAKVTIFAEATDNSAAFVETELLTDRTWSSTSLAWDITEPWTMWQPYASPDFKNVIQEVIGRSGWASGNALTIFLRGEDQGASLLDNARDFESFENIEDPEDGGDGLHHPERIPTLVINFTNGLTSVFEAQTKVHNLSLFPNVSADGQFRVIMEKPGMTSLYIYNTNGKLIKNLKSSSVETKLSLSNLPKGMYIVKAIQNNVEYAGKIVIK
jgi:hypothetical protein